MSPRLVLGLASVVIVGVGACSNGAQNGGDTSTSTSTGASGSGTSNVELKTSDGTSIGTATIEFANDYATVTVETTASNALTAGFHAVAIHSVGTCEGSFASAGDVLQVSGRSTTPASGALPDLLVRPGGAAKLVTTTAGFTPADLRGSQGSSLVIDGADAQSRVACGVVAPVQTASSTTSTTSSSTSTSTVTQTVVPSTSTVISTTVVTATSETPTSTTSTTAGSSTVTVTVPSTLPPVPNNPFAPNGG